MRFPSFVLRDVAGRAVVRAAVPFFSQCRRPGDGHRARKIDRREAADRFLAQSGDDEAQTLSEGLGGRRKEPLRMNGRPQVAHVVAEGSVEISQEPRVVPRSDRQALALGFSGLVADFCGQGPPLGVLVALEGQHEVDPGLPGGVGALCREVAKFERSGALLFRRLERGV